MAEISGVETAAVTGVNTDNWTNFANCDGLDPEAFFPLKAEGASDVQQVCLGCVAVKFCQKFQKDNAEAFAKTGWYELASI